METKRAYYTCPVMALLALKHGIELFEFGLLGDLWEIRDAHILGDIKEKQGAFKYYIKLESMYLLQPKRDDPIYLGERNGRHSVGFAGNHTLTDLIENGYEIMRRNNMPFPWPQFEDLNRSNSTGLEKEKVNEQ